MSGLVADPRWIEFGQAHAETAKGLDSPDGASERYRRAQPPYIELLAEHCANNRFLRRHMMRALVEQGLGLGVVLTGFKATKEEREWVQDTPPVEPEPVDEIDRLRSLPYAAYLRTEHWRRVRADALRRAQNRCQLCNRSDSLQVHHRSYDRRGAERPSDVIVLCDPCHTRHHGHLRAA